MCEQLVARAARPFPLGELWPLAERLERFGIAGFGWGISWIDGDGGIRTHRDTRAFRDDPGRATLAAVETTSVLLHLRRPSRLSTLQLPDTQPFDDPAGRFAFSHNGGLRDWRSARAAYQAAGRIHGRADTEVAQRWLEDEWTRSGDAAAALARLHERFGGAANLATLEPDGTVTHYAGNPENPLFAFRLGAIEVVSTGIYSVDRSVFRFAAIGATDRRLVRAGTAVTVPGAGGSRNATPRLVPAG